MIIERRKFLELVVTAAAAGSISGQVKKSSRPIPKSEYDYVDWSWEKWRSITKATRPRALGEHTGKAELIDLLTFKGKKVLSPNEWKVRRESIKNVLRIFL